MAKLQTDIYRDQKNSFHVADWNETADVQKFRLVRSFGSKEYTNEMKIAGSV